MIVQQKSSRIGWCHLAPVEILPLLLGKPVARTIVESVLRDTANRFGLRVSSADGQTTAKNGRSLACGWDADMPLRGFVEPMTGIEPAYSAWEAFPEANGLSKTPRRRTPRPTQISTAPAVSVRSAPAAGGTLRFGGVRGTEGYRAHFGELRALARIGERAVLRIRPVSVRVRLGTP